MYCIIKEKASHAGQSVRSLTDTSKRRVAFVRDGLPGGESRGVPAFSAPFSSRRNTTSNTARPLFEIAIKQSMPAMLSKGGSIFDKFRIYYYR